MLGLHCCMGYSLQCSGFSLRCLLLLRSTGSRSCGSHSQQLWHMGLVAPQHVESSWIRDWTRVSCIRRRILYHWATREAPLTPFTIFIWFTFRYFWLIFGFHFCLITLCQSVVFKKLNLWLSHQYQRRQWHPTPVLLPGKSHGRRSLVGCSPWGREESDTTAQLHFHFSLSCIGEGNGNPLQCSCLENPRDEGAWWADVHGVAQSRTQLKQLSSSSSTPI